MMWMPAGWSKARVEPFRQDGDLLGYMKPLFLLDTFLGMSTPKQGRLVIFWSYTVLLLVAMSISCLYNIVDTVEEFYDSFEAFQILFSCLAFVILAAMKKPVIEEALEELHRVDQALCPVGLVHRYEVKKLYTTILGRLGLVLLVCVFDAYSYTILPWTQDGVANIFSYYYFYFLFDLVQLQYNTLAITVGQHFNLINDKLLQSDVDMSVVLCSHSDLCGVSDLLHEYFSQQLFVVSAFVFCNNTSHAYCMISTIRSTTSGEPAAGEEEEGPRWSIFVLRGVFIVFRILELSWLIAASTFLEEQEFVDLHLSMKQEVDIWVCGCFKMDYTLLLTMLSAASTYIMVLIQYAPEKQPEFNVIKVGAAHETGNYTFL